MRNPVKAMFFAVALWNHSCSSYDLCSDPETIERVDVEIGSTLEVTCEILPECTRGMWIRNVDGRNVYYWKGNCKKNICQRMEGNENILRISTISLSDSGNYECRCDTPGYSTLHVICYYLMRICKMIVTVNGSKTVSYFLFFNFSSSLTADISDLRISNIQLSLGSSSGTFFKQH